MDTLAYPDLFQPLSELERAAFSVIEMPRTPPSFDLRTASDEQLAEFYLPPRPDPAREPGAYELWIKAMSGPLQWPDLGDRSPADLLMRASMGASLQAGVQEASSNWSGAIARTFDASRIRSIYGLWQVPDPKLAPHGAGPVFASSAWIGLDGHDPASRSLPQLGSGHWLDRSSGTDVKTVFLWWEWFIRDWPLNHYYKIEMPVKSKDWIYAQITKKGPATASFCLVNLSSFTKFIFPFVFNQTKSPV